MIRLIKTKLFTTLTGLNAVFDYQNFIEENPNIKIISVNVLKYDFVLLTYKENE
ncbi:acetate CoA-transferase [Clostridium botulinum]|uniref:acetate CoA-transferase n=1 Tax=Clostridium botulinum TaxID=1491 RepID=UPI001F61700C|nr:acetate CoA-transferase [Clostridium botulinum]WCJ73819.1 acetate CoA-transferase [Clostridium botulinum]WCJ77658.1 acetate CoA-transferase [Clostridium botulinum]WCJ81498.1 acetate CoA-transferase [Clostridium botulinum]